MILIDSTTNKLTGAVLLQRAQGQRALASRVSLSTPPCTTFCYPPVSSHLHTPFAICLLSKVCTAFCHPLIASYLHAPSAILPLPRTCTCTCLDQPPLPSPCTHPLVFPCCPRHKHANCYSPVASHLHMPFDIPLLPHTCMCILPSRCFLVLAHHFCSHASNLLC